MVMSLGRPETISIRAPARGATQLLPPRLHLPVISIRAAARGATRCGRFYPVLCIDFNPRSREGSDSLQGSDRQDPGISIRAPARGATAQVYGYVYGFDISIRAPARGATMLTDYPVDHAGISIRAPARGATASR